MTQKRFPLRALPTDPVPYPSWGTHAPILEAFVTASPKRWSILELGAGSVSTPLLIRLCGEQSRALVTYEHDPKYLESPMGSFHAIVRTPLDLMRCIAARRDCGERFGVCLVDNSPADTRPIWIVQLSDVVDFFVVHDTEDEHKDVYHWDGLLEKRAGWHDVRHFDDKFHRGIRTTVLSTRHKIEVAL